MRAGAAPSFDCTHMHYVMSQRQRSSVLTALHDGTLRRRDARHHVQQAEAVV